jgi:hypothetical protein
MLPEIVLGGKQFAGRSVAQKAGFMTMKSRHHRAKIGWKIGYERDKVYATNSDPYGSHRFGELTGAQSSRER